MFTSRRRVLGDVFDTRRKVDKSFGSGVIFILNRKSISSKEEEKSSKVKSGIFVRKKGIRVGVGSSKEEIFFETDSDGNIVKEGEYHKNMNNLLKMANVGQQEEEEEGEEVEEEEMTYLM